MELQPMDMVAIIAAVVFLVGLGFAVYFKIEDKKEEKRKKE